jgi:hypothetical protein
MFGFAVAGVGGKGVAGNPAPNNPPPAPDRAKGVPPPVLSPTPPPNIDTKSSKGLVDVPANKFTAAGVWAKTCVAAKPEGCPSTIASSKSLAKDKFQRGNAAIEEIRHVQ